MESAKKIIPFILVAIVFAVGGYFIGAGNLSNQEGALYKAPLSGKSSASMRTVDGKLYGTYQSTDPKCPFGGSPKYTWLEGGIQWFDCLAIAASPSTANTK